MAQLAALQFRFHCQSQFRPFFWPVGVRQLGGEDKCRVAWRAPQRRFLPPSPRNLVSIVVEVRCGGGAQGNSCRRLIGDDLNKGGRRRAAQLSPGRRQVTARRKEPPRRGGSAGRSTIVATPEFAAAAAREVATRGGPANAQIAQLSATAAAAAPFPARRASRAGSRARAAAANSNTCRKLA